MMGFFLLECILLLSQPSYTLCSVIWCHVCKERLCHSCIFPRCGPLQCPRYTREAVGEYLCIKLLCCYFDTLLEVRRSKSACRRSNISSRINTPPISINHPPLSSSSIHSFLISFQSQQYTTTLSWSPSSDQFPWSHWPVFWSSPMRLPLQCRSNLKWRWPWLSARPMNRSVWRCVYEKHHRAGRSPLKTVGQVFLFPLICS